MFKDQVVLIPALEPDERLPELIGALREESFDRIIVIDDGSSENAQAIFGETEALGAVVIRHDFNLGKGAALKTGLSAAIDRYGYGITVITADADGQHRPKDIARVALAAELHPGALILGTRDFSGRHVPWKSRAGNRITRLVFRLLTGVSCQDTQTGLRGIPPKLLPLALREEGSRYEYEMNFLTDVAEEAEFVSVPIETVYEDHNSCSHFRPVRDSLLIYGRVVRFATASISSALADYALFLLFFAAFGALAGTHSEAILAATAFARLLSGLLNFLLNKYWSFQSAAPAGGELVRYALLFFSLMGASGLGVILLGCVLPIYAAKPLVDTLLFFISYTIQKRWVFRRTSELQKGEPL